MASKRKKYYSISRRCENNIKRYLENWFHSEDLQRCNKSITHISNQHAYENILHELCTMEDRFYNDFDGRNLRRSTTKDDWKEFSIHSKLIFFEIKMKYNIFQYLDILNLLNVIYRMRNYSLTVDDELINDDDSGT